jgi:hypothetical protein
VYTAAGEGHCLLLTELIEVGLDYFSVRRQEDWRWEGWRRRRVEGRGRAEEGIHKNSDTPLGRYFFA